MENPNYKLPNAEEMIQWINGTLPDGERKKEIAWLVETDPFIAAAMEGALLDTQLSHLPQKISTPTKKGSFRSHFLGWGIGIGIGVLLSLVTFLIFSPSKMDSPLAHQNSSSPPILVDSSHQKMEIPPSPSSPENQEILPPQVPATKDEGIHQNTVSDNENIHPSTSIHQLPLREVKPLSSTAQNTMKPIITTIILANQKVYPYKERSSRPHLFSLENLHVNAAFENKNDLDNHKPTPIAIPYLEFLEQGIEAFNQQQWSLSGEVMNQILTQYSDDINALYFKGQICYYQGNKNQAFSYFNKVMAHPLGIFNQEAKEFSRLCIQ